MSYVVGKLNETGERIRETVMNSLRQIAADSYMNQDDMTQSVLEDIKILIDTAASIQQQTESDPLKLANTVLRLQLNFDEISKCREVKHKGRQILIQTAGVEASAIGLGSLLHLLECSLALSTMGGGILAISGLVWLQYRWRKIQGDLLERTTEFKHKLKADLLVRSFHFL
jgi:hypothetical protein